MRDFNKFINKYGSRNILVHTNKNIHCSCYDTLYNVANPDCEICNGSGYLSETKSVKMRQGGVTSTGTFLKPNDTQLGDINSLIRVFYLKDSEVSEDDLVCECDWNGQTPIIKSVYTINYIEHIKESEQTTYLKLITSIKACQIPKVIYSQGKVYVGVNNLVK